jgi:hypothetical protein
MSAVDASQMTYDDVDRVVGPLDRAGQIAGDRDSARRVVLDALAPTLPTAALADDARAWLAEIEWAELDREEALELPDEHAIAAIERHYDGGLAAFIADGAVA